MVEVGGEAWGQVEPACPQRPTPPHCSQILGWAPPHTSGTPGIPVLRLPPLRPEGSTALAWASAMKWGRRFFSGVKAVCHLLVPGRACKTEGSPRYPAACSALGRSAQHRLPLSSHPLQLTPRAPFIKQGNPGPLRCGVYSCPKQVSSPLSDKPPPFRKG